MCVCTHTPTHSHTHTGSMLDLQLRSCVIQLCTLEYLCTLSTVLNLVLNIYSCLIVCSLVPEANAFSRSRSRSLIRLRHLISFYTYCTIFSTSKYTLNVSQIRPFIENEESFRKFCHGITTQNSVLQYNRITA
jgi:hypothetical protein